MSCLLLAGCGAGSRGRAVVFNSLYSSGQYKAALENAVADLDEGDDAVLWDLQAASAAMAAGNYTAVCDYLDQAEGLSKDIDLQGAEANAFQATGEIIFNSYLVDYKPTLYDKILINTYKGIAFMGLGDPANARVEFNRAYDRQRRSVEKYRAEIKGLLKEEKKDYSQEVRSSGSEEGGSISGPVFNYDKAVEAARQKVQGQRMHNWKPYTSFVNPFSSYAGALFWLAYGKDGGDFNKALLSLKRLKDMAPSPVVDRDLNLVSKLLKGGDFPDDQVWIIVENGLGPVLEEFRVDLPLFLLGGVSPVKISSLALPRLRSRGLASPDFEVTVGEGTETAWLLSDMDRVVGTEFDAGYDLVIAKAVSSMLVKAASQYAASRVAGDWGAVFMGIAGAVTTQADLRIWSSLPKQYQVARIERPDDGVINLCPSGAVQSFRVEVPQASSSLVLVTMPTAAARPAVNVIALNP